MYTEMLAILVIPIFTFSLWNLIKEYRDDIMAVEMTTKHLVQSTTLKLRPKQKRDVE